MKACSLPVWVLVCVPGIAFGVWMGTTVPSVDYNQFYSASELVGTTHSYEWPALKSLESPRTVPIPTARLPIVLFAHKLLSWMPFRVARDTWFTLSVLAFFAAGWLWRGLPRRVAFAAACWSTPIACTLAFGQDVAWWLFAFAAGLVFLVKKWDVIAGIAFSLCIVKFHLAVGIPILLLPL